MSQRSYHYEITKALDTTLSNHETCLSTINNYDYTIQTDEPWRVVRVINSVYTTEGFIAIFFSYVTGMFLFDVVKLPKL